mmetsp:Transcript_14478/g.19025  ORF Transcript_14478/g.19025 Transcript_14478/m.19025 type:complete len:230 (-) Transcript_14478:228-917(-)
MQFSIFCIHLFLVFNFISRGKRSRQCSYQLRSMNKDVLSILQRSNKSIALGRVEPLDCSHFLRSIRGSLLQSTVALSVGPKTLVPVPLCQAHSFVHCTSNNTKSPYISTIPMPVIKEQHLIVGNSRFFPDLPKMLHLVSNIDFFVPNDVSHFSITNPEIFQAPCSPIRFICSGGHCNLSSCPFILCAEFMKNFSHIRTQLNFNSSCIVHLFGFDVLAYTTPQLKHFRVP